MKKVLLVVVCLMLLVMTFVGCSFEPVALADRVSETNGYYTYVVSRMLVPGVVYHRVSGVSNIGEISLNVASIGFTIADTGRAESVALSSYYYSSGQVSDNLHVEETNPYRQDFSYGSDTVYYSEMNLPSIVSSGTTIQRSVPFAVYVDSGFIANVEYVEWGNIYDSNIADIIPASVRSNFDSNYMYWGYMKLTAVNGHYMIIAFKVGDNSLSTLAGTTAQAQSMMNVRAFPAYRRYYMNFNVDEDSYNQGYDQGLADGLGEKYDAVYNQAYNAGKLFGYNMAINEGVADYSTFGGWAKAVLSLLDVKIFGSFGLRELLSIGVGIGVLAFVIKLLRN